MKNVLRVLCSLIFVFAVLLIGCDGCKGCGTKGLVPEKITEWRIPQHEKATSAELELGDYLDLTGSKIVVKYKDGDEKEYDVTYDMIDIYDMLHAHSSIGVKRLKVNFEENGITVSFDKEITVIVPEYKSKAIAEIEKKLPSTPSPYDEEDTAKIIAAVNFARSSIYTAVDAAEVSKIESDTKDAIDKIIVEANKYAKYDAINTEVSKIKDSLGTLLTFAIDETKDLNAFIDEFITDALSNYVNNATLNAKIAELKTTLTGSYEGTLNDLKTLIDNIDAKAIVELKCENNEILYKVNGKEFVKLCDLPAGGTGQDGKKVNLRVQGENIEWQHEGDTTWNTLIALAALKGDPGTPGTPGIPGLDGLDGVGVVSARIDNGILKLLLTDNSEIDVQGNIFQLVDVKIDDLRNQIAYEFDETKDGTGETKVSIAYKVKKLRDDLDDLTTKVNELRTEFDAVIADGGPIDKLGESRDLIYGVIKECLGIDLETEQSGFGVSFVNKLIELVANKETLETLIDKVITPYLEKFNETGILGRDITFDSIKERIKNALNARTVLITKVQEMKSIYQDNTLSAKDKLIEMLKLAKDYDVILSALGVSDERIAQIRSLAVNFKNTLVNFVKTQLTTLVNSFLTDYLYDFDALLVEFSSIPELVTYEAGIREYLNTIGYTGASKFVNLKAEILALIDSINVSGLSVFTDLLDTLTSLISKVVELQTIDSLNEVIPAYLATMLEYKFDEVLAKVFEKEVNMTVTEVVREDDPVTTNKDERLEFTIQIKLNINANIQDVLTPKMIVDLKNQKNIYLNAILKSKSVLEVAEYSRKALDALTNYNPFDELIKLVEQIEANPTEENVSAAEAIIKNIDDSVKNFIKYDIYKINEDIEKAIYDKLIVIMRSEIENSIDRDNLVDPLGQPITMTDEEFDAYVADLLATAAFSKEFLGGLVDLLEIAEPLVAEKIDEKLKEAVNDIFTQWNLGATVRQKVEAGRAIVG